MDYTEIIRRVRRLDFIRNDQTANAAVKAVLGSLAGRLSEEQARMLAGRFHGQLALDRFEGGNSKIEELSVADYTAAICAQFKISVYQARTLVRNVLYFTKEVSGASALLDIKKSLPTDWAEAIQNA